MNSEIDEKLNVTRICSHHFFIIYTKIIHENMQTIKPLYLTDLYFHHLL